MREEGIEAAYVFDSFVASHMEMMHRAMRAKLRSMAEEIGVPLKILELVMVIAAGEIDTAGEIADKFGVSRSLLSKNVEEAVRAGYIETAQDEKDRRVVRLRLTQRAQEAAGRCRGIRKDFYGSVCAGIDGESLKVCLQVLQQMWKNITDMTAQTEGAASCGKGDR